MRACVRPPGNRGITMRLYLPLVLSLSAMAAPLQWKAANPPQSQGLTLARGTNAGYRIVTEGRQTYAAIEPVKDYYARASVIVKVGPPVSGPRWLAVHYLDRGYGLISATGAKVLSMHATARLNTGKLRTAVFGLDNVSPEIRLQGIGYLQALELTDAKPSLDPIPDVPPAFTLRQPLDLVMSAGADARTVEGLPEALATLREQLPLVKALGFNGVESYVKWAFVERSPGVFDWSFYDAVVDEMERHGLRWFPLLIVGSAYALPDWIHQSKELNGYVCLEHGVEIDIPTIFNDKQVKYVRRFLSEFGKHYAARKALLGVRLGPSANYGEAQYPATGAWGYRWGQIHTHIGYWAGDPDATLVFRNWVRSRYPTLSALNEAWQTRYTSFDQVKTFLPETAQSPRMRVDFSTWYMDAMSDWCEKWAQWARQALPATSIYQSSGGWGAVPIGTDYTMQARSMAKLHGGIRLTNENDSYLNNFATTRMASSAARFYGAKLGYEPAGFSSARGVMARLYNTLANGADHLFYYGNNITASDQAPALWLKHAPLLDRRVKPQAEIAVFYPDTANKLGDDVLRYRQASTFFDYVHTLRAKTDFDYASEQMILDGALDRYKVLVFLWGRVAEKGVIEKIDQWLRAGGVIIYPVRQQSREGILNTIEDDSTLARAWQQGDTGRGRVLFFDGYAEPIRHYVDFIADSLRGIPTLSPAIQRGLRLRCTNEFYWTALSNGTLALLNYDDRPATVHLDGGKVLDMQPYSIAIE